MNEIKVRKVASVVIAILILDEEVGINESLINCTCSTMFSRNVMTMGEQLEVLAKVREFYGYEPGR